MPTIVCPILAYKLVNTFAPSFKLDSSVQYIGNLITPEMRRFQI